MADDGSLTLYQKLTTLGAVDVTAFVTSDKNIYLVIANNRDNLGNVQQTINVYLWSSLLSQFQSTQSIPCNDVQHVYSFTLYDGGPGGQ